MSKNTSIAFYASDLCRPLGINESLELCNIFNWAITKRAQILESVQKQRKPLFQYSC